MSASGSAADIVEYPDLAADMHCGFVTRRGFFAWSFTVEAERASEVAVSLVKID